VILPNYGKGSSPDAIRRVAEAAEELGFGSVWATEHIIVGPEAVQAAHSCPTPRGLRDGEWWVRLRR
jgi:alkanesulfonate monooxygenase SsuD/methylene tetrahydromethanopterin reductase-like flavin-dependent oxidoreductase (luciferase family)